MGIFESKVQLINTTLNTNTFSVVCDHPFDGGVEDDQKRGSYEKEELVHTASWDKSDAKCWLLSGIIRQ